MKIITISREFGSGGRELGKRLAKITGFSYYDHEILTAIANKKGLSEGYIDESLNTHDFCNMPLHIGRSFTMHYNSNKVDLLLSEKKIIEEIASLGEDCIIVGRNADVILNEYNPFSIFVCAQMESKIERCMERANKDECPSPREIIGQIRRIDKARMATRKIMTDSSWGDPHVYQLVVNTTDWKIDELAPIVKDFSESFFRRTR